MMERIDLFAEEREKGREEALADARRAIEDLIWDRKRLGDPFDDFQTALDKVGEL